VKAASVPHFSDASLSSARPGVASLDVLRFAAAAFIVIYHYGMNAPVELERMVPVLGRGWLATDFFLMLSGYVLSRSYGDRLATGSIGPVRFFVRRFVRLWPSHMMVLLGFGVFVVLCTLAGFPAGHADHYSPIGFIAEAFLVHGWGMFDGPVWNVPTWTLSALLVCYALYSLYAPVLYRCSRPALIGLAIAIVTCAHLLAVTLAHRALADLPYAWGLLRAIPLFLAGNLIERATRGWLVGQTAFWGGLTVCILSVVLVQQVPRSAVTDGVGLVALATLIALSGAVVFTETAVSSRLGRVSFSLFLTHSLIGALWFGMSTRLTGLLHMLPVAQWALWAAGIATALTAAFLFEALIDRPLSRHMSKLSFVKGEGKTASKPLSS
jgi:peptidoglycan/LPS O-acetylase OafA/YrhL